MGAARFSAVDITFDKAAHSAPIELWRDGSGKAVACTRHGKQLLIAVCGFVKAIHHGARHESIRLAVNEQHGNFTSGESD